MIAKTIDSALLSEGQALFNAIAQSPICWIDLAHRIKSKVIFKEALIHLTGRYNELANTPPEPSFAVANPIARSVLDQLHPEVRNLLEKKNKELKVACSRIEVFIVTHYPAQIQKESVTGRADRDDIGRQSYARDVFAWIAVCLYRHWIGQQFATVR